MMRAQSGFSLFEMLTVLFIISFVGMGMAELAVTQNIVAFRAYNKASGLINANRFGLLFQKDIHNCQQFVNCTGTALDMTVTSSITNSTTDQVSYTIESDPSDASKWRMVRTVNGGSGTVVLTNIVGPKSAGQPLVFLYIMGKPFAGSSYSIDASLPEASPKQTTYLRVCGVSVNLELTNNSESARKDMTPGNICIHEEVYATPLPLDQSTP